MISWLQNLAGYSSSSRLGRLNSDNSQVIVLQKDKNVARVPSDKLGDVVNTENQNVANMPSDKFGDVVNTENQNVARVPGSVVNSLEIGELYQPSDSADKLLNAQLTIHASIENIPHEELNKLLLRASQDGNLELVQNLEAAGAGVHAQDPNGLNPLHHAAAAGDPEMVQFLVGRRIDVNVPDPDGLTPLHYAVVKGHPEVVQSLVGSGANLKVLDCNGNTILHYVAARPIACPDDARLVKLLCESGEININTPGLNRMTPLHNAAAAGHHAMVALLLDNGADVNVQDSDVKTALHHAVAAGNPEMVALLLDNGADVNVQDSDVKTALHFAVGRIVKNRDDTTKASLLLAKGADPTITDKYGNNVSHQILSQYIAHPNDKWAELFYQILQWRGVLTQQNTQEQTLCNLLLAKWFSLDINFLQQVLCCLGVPMDNIKGMGHDALQKCFVSAIRSLTKSACNVEESTPSDAQQKVSEEIEEVALVGEGDSDNAN